MVREVRRVVFAAVASGMKTEVGRVLGDRYRIAAPIGAGRSAHVFQAEDLRLQRRVAVKVLVVAVDDDRDLLPRFQREAQLAAALNHLNILSVLDWGQDEGQAFLVTEYVAGGSLRAMLSQGRLLSPSQTLRVGLDAARGLEFAHRHGLVHGDVQPSDLLFGSDGRLRLADFGLARALAAAATAPAPAGGGPAATAPSRYAAPEQEHGGPATAASDIYSLGLVLVEAVTGEVPSIDPRRGAVAVPDDVGPLRPVLEAATRTEAADRLDAHALAVGLMGAAGQLKRPAPLPLAGAGADADTEPAAVFADEPTAVIAAPPPAASPPSGAPIRRVVVPAPAPPIQPAEGPTAELEPFSEVVDVRSRRRWPLLAVLVLLVAVVAGAFALVRSAESGVHRVPDVTGEPLATALPKVANFGWKVSISHTRKDGAPAYQVLSATPKVGSRLRKGDRLTLLVSDGNTLVRVPADVRGKSQTDAQAEIQAVGLVAKPSFQFDEDIAKGNVVGLGPNTPPDLPKLDPVALVVSNGPAPRTVPEGLAGLTYDAAAQKLKDVHLKPVAVYQYNDDKSIPSGQVFDTNPKADTQVQRDSEVQLNVSKGPTPVVVPSVVNLPVDQAKSVLTNAGFSVARDVSMNFSDTVAAGSVIATSPAGGSQVQPGSTVSLVASRGPDLVAVPSVLGTRSIQEAVTVLQSAGFQVGGASGLATGKPIATDPPAGTRLKRGGLVNIVLG